MSREPDFKAGMTITDDIFRSLFYDYTQDYTPGQTPLPPMEPFILHADYYKFKAKNGKTGLSRSPQEITS